MGKGDVPHMLQNHGAPVPRQRPNQFIYIGNLDELVHDFIHLHPHARFAADVSLHLLKRGAQCFGIQRLALARTEYLRKLLKARLSCWHSRNQQM